MYYMNPKIEQDGDSTPLHNKMRSDVYQFSSVSSSHEDDCFYCSDKSTDMDHTIPHSFVRFKGARRQYTTDCVPACRECNLLLTNRIHGSLSERLNYLCEKVKAKNFKLLNMPDWHESELKEMGNKLRQEIRKFMIKKAIARHRVKTLEGNAILCKNNED